MTSFNALPVIGTVPEKRPQPPASGRWKVVEAEGANFLYAPEIQRLFDMPQEMARAFHLVENYGTEEEKASVNQLVREIVADDEGPDLSRKRHESQGVKSLVVHVSQACNLACTYCYANELNKANKLMPLSVAQQVVERMDKLSTSGLSSVNFLGGEPTFAWLVIE